MIKKTEARKIMSGKRNAMDEDSVALLSRRIAENAYTFISDNTFRNIGIYNGIGKEVRIEYITDIDKNERFEFYMPSCIQEGAMEFRKFDEKSEFERDFYGIPCPSGVIKANKNDIDVYFIPGLAYDIYGNRVGYGKGCYDKFFEGSKAAKLIGICYDFQFIRNETLENSDEDVKVSGVITENGLYIKI